jgi:hypothetical protein
MTDGYKLGDGGLGRVARRLDRGSDDLEGLANPPSPVDAGDVTAEVNDGLAEVVRCLGAVVDGISAAGRAVAASEAHYLDIEHNARKMFE